MNTSFSKTTKENTYTFSTTTPSEKTRSEMRESSLANTNNTTQEPLRVGPPTKPAPIGDALCPLLVLVASYFLLRYFKVTKNRRTRHTIAK